MIQTGQQLLCAPEIKRYILNNSLTNEEHMVTMDMVIDAFGHNDVELQKILSGRSPVWFLEEYFE